MLEMDDVEHRAFWTEHGTRKELARLTSAMADVGLIDTQYFTEASRARGTMIHAAVKLLFDGADVRLSFRDSWPTSYDGYWDGYLAFLAETEFEPELCEEDICDLGLGYAGRLDLVGRLPRLEEGPVDLIDVKTGSAPPYVGAQTMGYRRRLLIDGVPAGRVRRWALELPGNGRYRLLPLNMHKDSPRINREVDLADEQIVLAAVRIMRWKRGW